MYITAEDCFAKNSKQDFIYFTLFTLLLDIPLHLKELYRYKKPAGFFRTGIQNEKLKKIKLYDCCKSYDHVKWRIAEKRICP